MIDEALEMDDEFARLLDEYHSAYLSGSTIGFWNQHTCSKELITRVEQAHEGLKQLDRYLSDSVTRPQNAVLDSNAFGNFIAQPTQLGRFKLIRELGRGGFGVVYLAEDPSLNRNVAIKIPRIETLVNDSLRQRFVQEAEIAASLDHLHILPVFEIGETQHGIYIVSLYCPGTNLSQWLRDRSNQLSIRQSVELVICLADAMAYCHERHVLHRDIKPANVLLFPSAFGSLPFLPRINDFGLAKVMETSLLETASSVLLGTPQYMAPEQACSRMEDVGPATDVYALGAILYELLTETPTFTADSLAAMLDQIRSSHPEPLRNHRQEIPVQLETICLKCLAKEPKDRYASASELLNDLRRFVDGSPILAKRLSVSRKIDQWMSDRQRLHDVSLVVVMVNIVMIGTMVFSMLMAQFQMIPSSANQSMAPILSCISILIMSHVPLIFVGRAIKNGKWWPTIVCFVTGLIMTVASSCFMLGLLSSGNYYWNDIPGFRVVYGAVCMLSVVQMLASYVAWYVLEKEQQRNFRRQFEVASTASLIVSPTRSFAENRNWLRSLRSAKLALFAGCAALAFVPIASVISRSSIKNDETVSKSKEFERSQIQSGASFGEIDEVYVAAIDYEANTSVTIEAWVQPEYPSGMILNFCSLISLHSDDGNEGSGPSVQITLDKERYLIFQSQKNLPIKTWSHLALTYDGSKICFFVNGLKQDYAVFISDENRVELLDKAPGIVLKKVWKDIGLVIGGNAPASSESSHHPFHGEIRQIRISKTVHYQDAFKPELSLEFEADSIALYKLSPDRPARINDLAHQSPPALLQPFTKAKNTDR